MRPDLARLTEEERAILTRWEMATKEPRAHIATVLKGYALDDIPVALASIADLRAELDRVEGERDAWEEMAAQGQRNTDFYRGIVVDVGKRLGPDVYVSDDGSVQKDVLALKVESLVEALVADRDALAGKVETRGCEGCRWDKRYRKVCDSCCRAARKDHYQPKGGTDAT